MPTRRTVLKRVAVGGALLSGPTAWGYRLWQQQSQRSGQPPQKDRRTVAAIGIGKRGSELAREASKHARLVAICDVQDNCTAAFLHAWHERLERFRDHRELLEKVKPDVVAIATPDHWHVPIAIDALQAGCDVYCEKPLTLTIEEGQRIQRVVEQTGRVLQVGTQQRSEYGGVFALAAAIVRSGRLGKHVRAHVAIGSPPEAGLCEPCPMPLAFDWQRWLGSAPRVPYCEERRKGFRWWFEYAGGKLTDWGAHHVDIAQWALGLDHTGPVRVSGTGSLPQIVPENFDWAAFFDGEATLPSTYNTPQRFHVDLRFADGATIGVHHRYTRDDVDFADGVLFEGEADRIFVNREKLQGTPVDDLTGGDRRELNDLVLSLRKGKPAASHMANFFDCIEDRQQPVSDVACHPRTVTSCHLCNLAPMLGRDLNWIPGGARFDDDAANSLIGRGNRQLESL